MSQKQSNIKDEFHVVVLLSGFMGQTEGWFWYDNMKGKGVRVLFYLLRLFTRDGGYWHVSWINELEVHETN